MSINAVNSLSDSGTGIGVVVGFAAIVLIREGPQLWSSATHWKVALLHILQEVSGICTIRYQVRRMLPVLVPYPSQVEKGEPLWMV